ncbi:LytR/AlgR family response regulator transcription factor [Thalassotalea hakodatensis]|uniref:LytR/AlgR family response regulator transcription factor n=1 Tax=Thalassotalea hakodatensis TaxID=3030492 RepID=UPI0025743CC1|nr:LytTR family DNA-binding domain-containing protein [Thalassotalea hakodatensis]
MISVLIADDEHLARKTIQYLLQNQADIGDIYFAENGNQVIELAKKHHPDIIFLDIQMPGKSGLQAAELLEIDAVIVFATAFDQYAISAFELNAIDYLLKPFDDDRFYQALDKAKRQVANNQVSNLANINELIIHLKQQADSPFKTQLVVKDPGRIRLIDVDDIEYIQGAGNYADIHLINGDHLLHRATLTMLETQLNPKEFIRIHRSSIVNRQCVRTLTATETGDYLVQLNSKSQLTLSRRNKNKLDTLLNLNSV